MDFYWCASPSKNVRVLIVVQDTKLIARVVVGVLLFFKSIGETLGITQYTSHGTQKEH